MDKCKWRPAEGTEASAVDINFTWPFVVMALKVEWEVGSREWGVGSGSPYGPANPIAQQPGRQPQLPPTASQVSCQWLRPGNGVNPTCQLSLAISVSRLPRGNSALSFQQPHPPPWHPVTQGVLLATSPVDVPSHCYRGYYKILEGQFMALRWTNCFWGHLAYKLRSRNTKLLTLNWMMVTPVVFSNFIPFTCLIYNL